MNLENENSSIAVSKNNLGNNASITKHEIDLGEEQLELLQQRWYKWKIEIWWRWYFIKWWGREKLKSWEINWNNCWTKCWKRVIEHEVTKKYCIRRKNNSQRK